MTTGICYSKKSSQFTCTSPKTIL